MCRENNLKKAVFLTTALDQHIKQVIHLLAGGGGTLQRNQKDQ